MKKIMLIVISLSALIIVQVSAQNLTIMSEENAPFNFSRGGSVEGIGADLLVAMLEESKRSENRADISMLPWARAYSEVQNTPNTLLFSMGRTESREDLFKWVGPIYHLQIGLISKKSSGVSINSSQDFKKYTIGTVREGAPEQLLINAGADESSLDRTSSLESNLKKLMAGRLDIIAFNVPAALYNLKSMGADVSEYEVVYVLKDLDLYYAFHKSTDAGVIKSLQSSLDSVIQNGDYDKIVNKYLN